MNFDTLKSNLEEKGYIVSCFKTAQEATDYLTKCIQEKCVGFGGSVTLQEMGVYERLSEKNTVFWHWRPTDNMTSAEICAKAGCADIYISSVNGIAESGEIVNIDGNCNRVSAIVYGHEKVYLVVGVNKVASDLENAIHRARNIAAPKNAQRLHRNTPCAVNGNHCYDCKSPERICCNLSVLWKKPTSCVFEVLLINEVLGY